MFYVIYHFEVIPGKEGEFIEGWEGLTNLIYTHEGSYGSRLHKSSGNSYLAYAAWPSSSHFKEAGANLPPTAQGFRDKMRQSCIKITTEHELELVVDLLKDSIHTK